MPSRLKPPRRPISGYDEPYEPRRSAEPVPEQPASPRPAEGTVGAVYSRLKEEERQREVLRARRRGRLSG